VNMSEESKLCPVSAVPSEVEADPRNDE
jgi:hypothetical protein